MDPSRDALPPFFVLVGAVTALLGIVPLLAALDLIPAEDSSFGAPRWIVALFGLAFVAVGLLLVLRALPSWRPELQIAAPWIHRGAQVCAVLVLVAFFGGMLAFLNWKAFVESGGDGELVVTLFDLPVRLPPTVARIPERFLVTAFALGVDLLVAASLWKALARRPRE